MRMVNPFMGVAVQSGQTINLNDARACALLFSTNGAVGTVTILGTFGDGQIAFANAVALGAVNSSFWYFTRDAPPTLNGVGPVGAGVATAYGPLPQVLTLTWTGATTFLAGCVLYYDD